MLLSAARAGLFLESIEAGKPQLALTVAASAAQLAGLDRNAEVALDAYESYRVCRLEGRQPSARTVAELRDVVLGLGAYGSH
jgi:hypothetical protein